MYNCQYVLSRGDSLEIAHTETSETFRIWGRVYEPNTNQTQTEYESDISWVLPWAHAQPNAPASITKLTFGGKSRTIEI